MEYSFEFSKRLIESAESLIQKQGELEEVDRTILYLSCLSCEISLKALLETSGATVKSLISSSHNLEKLLKKVSSSTFKTPDEFLYDPNDIRSKMVAPKTGNGTVGHVLSATKGTSKYPNEIRYGDDVKHFSPDVMLECARVVNTWCVDHKGKLDIKLLEKQ